MEQELELITKKKMSLTTVAGICFSVTAILFVAVQILGVFGLIPEVFFTNIVLNLTVAQIGFILLPTLVILFVARHNIKDALRLNKPKISEILISASFPIVLFPAMLGLATIALLIVGLLFGSTNLDGLEPLTSTSLWLLILIGALLPGICEEVLFRGAVLSGLQKNGIVFGIIASAILFGLFHMDPQRFVAQALMGAVAAIVVYRTNSIFTGMTVHFTNNAFSFLISDLLRSSGAADEQSQSTDIMETIREQSELFQIDFTLLCIMMIVIMLMVTLFFAALTIPLFYALFRITKKKVQQLPLEREPFKLSRYWPMVPGLLIIIGFYCLVAVSLAS